MRETTFQSASGRAEQGPAEVHVSSLLVHCQPGQLESIAPEIESHPDAEIHAIDPCGKIIVTLETESEGLLRDRIEAIRRLAGVLSTSLVYHQVEPA